MAMWARLFYMEPKVGGLCAWSAAGRPLINAAGKPRGSSTAPAWITWQSRLWSAILQGGGFVILNGMTFDENGKLRGWIAPILEETCSLWLQEGDLTYGIHTIRLMRSSSMAVPLPN
jgi:hypothetical protein